MARAPVDVVRNETPGSGSRVAMLFLLAACRFDGSIPLDTGNAAPPTSDAGTPLPDGAVPMPDGAVLPFDGAPDTGDAAPPATHRQWSTPRTLSTRDAADAWGPDFAADASGVFTVVWEQHGTEPTIHAMQFVPATGWGAATSIQAAPGFGASPHIAVNAAGDIVAVWAQHDGTHYSVWANRVMPGAGWGNAVLLETYHGGDASYAQVAIDPAGNATAIWLNFVDGRADIWASRFVPGIGWSAAGPVESNDSGSADGIQIVAADDGSATAVWGQGPRQIWAARFVPGAGWQSPTLIREVEAGYAAAPQAVVDPAGRTIVGWSEFGADHGESWMTRYVPGTGWEIATRFAAGQAPTIAFDDAGNGTAVWVQHDVDHFAAWTRRFDATTGWDAPMLLGHDVANVGFVDVDVTPAGVAVAVWDEGDIDDRQVHTSIYTPGVGWSSPAILSDRGDAFFPQVTVDQAGNATAAWVQRNGAIEVMASTYR